MVSTSSLSPSIPVFSTSAPISFSTASICARTAFGGVATTPLTPSVFWIVSAVIAVAAYPPSAVTVLISA
jgi:hypothetical protein